MNAAAQQTPDASSSDRNARGQFAHGNPGGPGRPPKTLPVEREVIALLAREISPEDWSKVAQAVLRKAGEGNMTAITLLFRTFLSGRLNAAAAAEAIGLPAEVEMLELGCKLHAGWAKLIQKQQRANQAKEPDAEAGSTAPCDPAACDPVSSQEAGSAAKPAASSHEPDATRPAASTVEHVPSNPSAAAQPPVAPPARTTPPAERVRGFRVTKGPRPENGRNRRKAGKTPTFCAAG